MGRRRGRVGPGGAVVSSLSIRPGGVVRGRPEGDEQSVDAVAAFKQQRRQQKLAACSDADADNDGGTATRSSLRKWTGATPQSLLREWLRRERRRGRLRIERASGERWKVVLPSSPDATPGSRAQVIWFDAATGAASRASGDGVVGYPEEERWEEYAALKALFQVDAQRSYERALSPAFARQWQLYQEEAARREQMERARQADAARRQRAEQEAIRRQQRFELQTVELNMNETSRQLVEEALGQLSLQTRVSDASPSITADAAFAPVQHQLVREGFLPADARAALGAVAATDATSSTSPRVRFRAALDWLCLHLDEEDLPERYRPSRDVEVVRYAAEVNANAPSNSGRDADARRSETPPRTDELLADRQHAVEWLARAACVGRARAERAWREHRGDACTALRYLLYGHVAQVPDPDDRDVWSTLSSAERAQAVAALQEEWQALHSTFGEAFQTRLPLSAVRALRLNGADGDGPFAFQLRVPLDCAEADNASRASSSSPTVTLCVAADRYPFGAPLLWLAEWCDPPPSRNRQRALLRTVLREAHRRTRGREDTAAVTEREPVLFGVVEACRRMQQGEMPGAAKTTGTSLPRGATPAEVPPPQRPSMPRRPPPRRPARHRQRDTQLDRLWQQREQQRRARATPSPSRLPARAATERVLTAVHAPGALVSLIQGATGSGKTTQCPAILLEDALLRGEVSRTFILVTQPRRIAAVSVAQRVAWERGERALGDDATAAAAAVDDDDSSLVGYQVRAQAHRSRSTRLLFCTTGIVLRMLHSDPQLRAVSHLVVDEVHERDLDTDFLLLLVRRLLRSGCRDEGDPLRVVLMSATVDAERLREYFYGEHAAPDAMPVVPIEGRTFSVRMRWWDEMWTEWEKRGEREASTDDEADDGDDTGASDGMEDGVEKVDPPAAASSASQTRWDVRHGASLALVEQAVRYADRELLREASQPLSPSPTPPHPAASILVFLPGVAEIEQLRARLARHARYHVVRLHASLSPEAQALAFRPCPRPATQQRKVVCATNIAESSVTVEDVVAVVDTCRVRQMHAVDIEMSGVQLRETWCSRASAVQRAGRAGRVRPGVCYRLVDRETVWEREMEAHTSPEMVRLPVDRLLLSLMMMMMMTTTTTTTGAPSKTPSLQEAMDVLLQDALDPPPLAHVQQSARRLERMGAVRNAQQTASAGMLTPLGTHLATMPLDAAVGKLLLYGALFGCVHAVLTLAAVVTEGTPFRRSPDDAERVRRACEQRFGRAHSDLLTDAAAFEAWQEKAERAQKSPEKSRALEAWLEECGLSRRTLYAIRDTRRQLQRLLRDWEIDGGANDSPPDPRLVCGIVFAALFPHLVRVDLPERPKYRDTAGGTIACVPEARSLRLVNEAGRRVFLHPSSVAFRNTGWCRSYRWLTYVSCVTTTKAYLRAVTPVPTYAVLLFGGDGVIEVQHQQQLITVDRWARFRVPARIGVLVREVRRAMDAALEAAFGRRTSGTGEGQREWASPALRRAVLQLLQSEA
ncbi:hypothetical protein CDCA_CDCA20G4856 [Cyanidium caldarium]|uniref:Uncharacterized protein n=1 Tax=Cyanidium caldarium TaxID=2771 RepID=A0AAV9J358_CYACA|nr:hypothetical protein CDCA_CDCA20G4856 [Cyanidium caldarium]